MRLAVIGGLAAGPAAAAEAKRRDPAAEVVLFEASAFVSVGACETRLVAAGVLDDLPSIPAETLASTRGLDVRTRHRVDALDVRTGTLTVEAMDHGSRYTDRFDRFILATGARARRLGIAGEDAHGVFALRSKEDAHALRDWLDTEPVRHVVVAGAGPVGVELAEAVRLRGLRATILAPEGRALAGLLHADLGAPLASALRAAGVALRAERAIEILTNAAGRVRAVRTDRGELIGCQAVIVAVGIEPRTELARAAGIRLGATGGLAADDQMRTSARTVWACGDGAEVRRVVDGASVLWPVAPVARQTGRVAARNAVRRGGPPATFAGVTGAAAVVAFGLELAAVGLSERDAAFAGLDAVAVQVAGRSRSSVTPGGHPLWVRLLAERGSGRLLGGQVMGAEGAAWRANVLVPLLRARATARDLAEDTDLLYTPPVGPAVDPLRVAAARLAAAAR
jgi:NADPH-dependent 2,4-dienoyl-CoA reductase/sulfur reductase-like enzyme